MSTIENHPGQGKTSEQGTDSDKLDPDPRPPASRGRFGYTRIELAGVPDLLRTPLPTDDDERGRQRRLLRFWRGENERLVDRVRTRIEQLAA